MNIQHLEYYKNIYRECRNSLKKFKIGTTFNSQDWTWHDKGVLDMPTDDCFPKMSGTIALLNKLQHRITAMYKDADMYDYPLFENERGKNILDLYNLMLQDISAFMKHILSKWFIECWASIQESMAITLLKRMENGNICVNFSDNLKTALKDIKVLRLLDCELTPNLIKFFTLEEDLWQARIKLLRIAEWINDINERAHETERDLMALSELKLLFWRKWSRDYLLSLQQRVQWSKGEANLVEGAVVLVHDDNSPPQRWITGRVTRAIAGEDGKVRVAEIKTAAGVIKRPIHKLAFQIVEDRSSSTGPECWSKLE
ncbi:hypothetical protein ACLKA6_016358 [Drosophila palustris]